MAKKSAASPPKKSPRRRSAASAPTAKTYAGAGVDIEAGDSLVDFIREHNPAIGGFSGLAALPAGMKRPRLVMSTDGVGTKLLVAQAAGIHRTIGIDLVAMVVNDIIVCGARPLWFLDYFATGALKQGEAREVLAGIMEGCRLAGCELVGGETAEMPGMYAPGHYDLAGFGVGVVEAGDALDGAKVRPGDVILGLESSGLHSNGYSLARSALLPRSAAAGRRALAAPIGSGGRTLAEAMLEPTTIYVKLVTALLKKHDIRAMANITGGGIAGNLVRVLPRGVRAEIRVGSWPVPEIFCEIERRGPVAREEMLRVFNMGVGYIIVCPAEEARAIIRRSGAAGIGCHAIGEIVRGTSKSAEPEVTVD